MIDKMKKGEWCTWYLHEDETRTHRQKYVNHLTRGLSGIIGKRLADLLIVRHVAKVCGDPDENVRKSFDKYRDFD